jgi:hypothetical protein
VSARLTEAFQDLLVAIAQVVEALVVPALSAAWLWIVEAICFVA